MEIKKFVEELRLIKEENDKLRSLKERYVDHAKELQAISQELAKIMNGLNSLARAIDPVIQSGHKNSREKNKEMVGTLFQELKSGKQLYTSDFQKLFPGESPFVYFNLSKKLRKLPGVQCVKDGAMMRHYYVQPGSKENKIVLSSITKPTVKVD